MSVPANKVQYERKLLEATLILNGQNVGFDLFYKTEIRARHTNQFIFVFERLINHVSGSDTDNMLFDSLIGSGHGLLYARMKEHQVDAPPAWDDHSKTTRQIDF